MAKQLTQGQQNALSRKIGKVANTHTKQTWEELKEHNLTDEELAQIIGEKWGYLQGTCGPNITPICCKGENNPRVWFDYGTTGKPDLQGIELLNQVRIILDMPRPPTDGQLSLF